MRRPNRTLGLLRRGLVVLGILGIGCEAAHAQSRRTARKPRPSPRVKEADKDAPVADRVVLRNGKEVLGQIVAPGPDGEVTILARRDWIRANLADRMRDLEAAEVQDTAAARAQREHRLRTWRDDRPATPAGDDRITAWLDRELSSRQTDVPYLMTISIGREEVKTVQRRGPVANQALRSAWLLDLKDPETRPLSTLADVIASKGMPAGGDEALDRLLPASAIPDRQWLLRRAATEALHDDGLRFIQFANTIIPEPGRGQPLDPSLNLNLIDNTIKDVLGVGRPDPFAQRFHEVGDRGRVGMMVTRVVLAADLSGVMAESTLFYRAPAGWERGIWRSASLDVGDVPPAFVNVVASDPQVKSLSALVDSIGMGLVSSEMKQAGLNIGTTVGAATIMARTSLTKVLMGMAFDVNAGRRGKSGPD